MSFYRGLKSLVEIFMPSASQEIRSGTQIIVCVKAGGLKYFISEPHYWVLDRNKSFPDLAQSPSPHSSRFGIAIVDQGNHQVFLEAMGKFQKSASELKSLISREVTDHGTKGPGFLEFFPTLLVDFDEKKLFSLGSESYDFEDFVPNGWTSAVEDFLSTIPLAERYWVVETRDLWRESQANAALE